MTVAKNSRGGGPNVLPSWLGLELAPIPRETKLAKWGPGPWVDEPDHETGTRNGIDWALVRDPDIGHWTGLVHVPAGHVWHGAEAHEIRPYVHGGVTFAYAVPDGMWRIGFDCAHAHDFVPLLATGSRLLENYRDHDYALSEVIDLADQAAQAAGGRAT